MIVVIKIRHVFPVHIGKSRPLPTSWKKETCDMDNQAKAEEDRTRRIDILEEEIRSLKKELEQSRKTEADLLEKLHVTQANANDLRTTLEEIQQDSILLQALMENIPDGIVITGGPPDYPIEHISRNALKMTGNESEKGLIGMPSGQNQVAWKIFLPDGVTRPTPEQMPLYRASRLGETVFNEEFVMNTKEGERLSVLVSAAPVRDENGNIVAAINTFRDFTGRKHGEEALRVSEERFSKAFRASPDALLITHLDDGHIVEVNESFTRLFGYSRSEAIGKTTLALNLFKDARDRTKILRLIREQGYLRDYEFEVRARNGDLRYVSLSAEPFLLNQEEQLVTLLHDLTERKQAEEALRASEERFRVALKNAPITVFTTDTNLRYTWVSEANKGFLPRDVIGKRHDEISTAEDVTELIALKQSVLDTGKRIHREIHLRLDGQGMVYDVTVEPARNEDGQITGLIVAAVDITESLQLKAEMVRREERLEIQRRISQEYEEERTRIARDLHDGPLQELIASYYEVSAIQNSEDREERNKMLEKLSSSVEEQVSDLRAFCNELRPPILVPFGLEKAIRSHLEQFRERHPDIQVSVELQPDYRAIPEDIRMILYRTYQETMNNIVKHAQATRIDIRFHFDDQHAEQELHYNGTGFMVPKNWVQLARQGHLGLVGMRERIERIGGELEVISAPGKGTTVRVEVPLSGVEE